MNQSRALDNVACNKHQLAETSDDWEELYTFFFFYFPPQFVGIGEPNRLWGARMRMYSKPNEARTKEMQIAGDTLPPPVKVNHLQETGRNRQTDIPRCVPGGAKRQTEKLAFFPILSFLLVDVLCILQRCS